MFDARSKALIPLFVFAWLICAHAQYELPNEIFARTLLIRSGNEMATAFKFDHDGRIYLVTTRHLGKTLPPRNAIVQVWHGNWVDLQTTQTVFPTSKDVDLAILEVDEKIGRPPALQCRDGARRAESVPQSHRVPPVPRMTSLNSTPASEKDLASCSLMQTTVI